MKKRKTRYAVVGLGHIAQVAILPAFKQCRNSELVALVSGDDRKLRKLGAKYAVSDLYRYEGYDRLLRSGRIDAVFIALPNRLHRDYAVRAARAGIHVLCEKPMAVTARDSERILRAARAHRVKLMIAYRLHFDPANLQAIQIVNSGKIGEARYFASDFGYTLKPGNIRLQPAEGGGPLHDIGIYCINAARYLFKAEPTEVFAYAATADRRYAKIHETVSAVMRFPGERLATFTCSFGSAAIANYRVVGTRGDLLIDNAYEYVGELEHRLTIGEKTRRWVSKPGDQFAAEIEHFSDCVLNDHEPAPSGQEGLNDVRIVEALYRSIKTGRPISLRGGSLKKVRRPSAAQRIKRPAHRKPDLIKAKSASR